MSATTAPRAEITRLTGEDERQIHRICEAGFFKRPKVKGKYDVQETVRGIIAYYRAQANKVGEAKAADMARERKAAADIAELDLAERMGELISVKEGRVFFGGAVIEIQNGVRGMKDLTPDQRRRICELGANAVKGLKEGVRHTTVS